MKLLLIGSDSKWSIDEIYGTHLKKLCELTFFNAHGKFLDYYHSSIINKLRNRLGLDHIISDINYRLKELIQVEAFDAILVFKGMELKKETLEWIKGLGIALFNYNPDHPFDFFSRGAGNKNVLQGLPFYHHITYSKKIQKDLLEKYELMSDFLPFGYGISSPPERGVKEINRLCFIGNPDQKRVAVISNLIDHQIPVDIYGNNWKRFLKESNMLKINEAVYRDDFVEIAKKYRAHINIFRPHNIDSHNMRTFEIPALGCILLSHYSEEQGLFFKGEKEMFYYNSTNLVEVSKRVLGLNFEQAFEIKSKAYNRSVQSKYDYKNRASKLFKLMELNIEKESK